MDWSIYTLIAIDSVIVIFYLARITSILKEIRDALGVDDEA